MEIQEDMIKPEKDFRMYFELQILFAGVEIKSGTVNLKSFLKTSERVVQPIEHLCSFKSHVNFAETIVNGLSICGEIKSVFNHRKFSGVLKNFQREINSKWDGHYIYRDGRDNFIFYAPDFESVDLVS